MIRVSQLEERKGAEPIFKLINTSGITREESDSGSEDDEQSQTCLLMTSEDRYYIYKYTFVKGENSEHQLVFKRPKDPNNNAIKNKPIVYNLSEIQVCTIDSCDEKNVCMQKRHFAMNILMSKSRKVYFTTFEQMMNCMHRISELQGYHGSRAAQYEKVQRLRTDEEDDSERYLVRQKNNDRTFIMKVVDERISPNILAVVMSERDILIRSGKSEHVVKLFDSFSEKNKFYMLIENPKGDSLKKTVLKLGKSYLKESDVKKCAH